MRWVRRILIGLVVLGSLTYLYYTEVKPVVIFGLRSDYAHAIPHQKLPEGLTSLRAESCGTCHTDIYNEWKNENTSTLLPIKISFDAAWNKRSQKGGKCNSNSGFTNAIGRKN